MLFITNRSPQGSFVTTPGRDFIFDLLDNTPSASVYYCQRDRLNNKDIELGSDNFLQAIETSQVKSIFVLSAWIQELARGRLHGRSVSAKSL